MWKVLHSVEHYKALRWKTLKFLTCAPQKCCWVRPDGFGEIHRLWEESMACLASRLPFLSSLLDFLAIFFL